MTSTSQAAALLVLRVDAVTQLLTLRQRVEANRRAVELYRRDVHRYTLPSASDLPAAADLTPGSYASARAAVPTLVSGVNTAVPSSVQMASYRTQYTAALRRMLVDLEQSPAGVVDQLELELSKKLTATLASVAPLAAALSLTTAADTTADIAQVAEAQQFLAELRAGITLIDADLKAKIEAFRQVKARVSVLVGVNPRR